MLHCVAILWHLSGIVCTSPIHIIPVHFSVKWKDDLSMLKSRKGRPEEWLCFSPGRLASALEEASFATHVGQCFLNAGGIWFFSLCLGLHRIEFIEFVQKHDSLKSVEGFPKESPGDDILTKLPLLWLKVMYLFWCLVDVALLSLASLGCHLCFLL